MLALRVLCIHVGPRMEAIPEADNDAAPLPRGEHTPERAPFVDNPAGGICTWTGRMAERIEQCDPPVAGVKQHETRVSATNPLEAVVPVQQGVRRQSTTWLRSGILVTPAAANEPGCRRPKPLILQCGAVEFDVVYADYNSTRLRLCTHVNKLSPYRAYR